MLVLGIEAHILVPVIQGTKKLWNQIRSTYRLPISEEQAWENSNLSTVLSSIKRKGHLIHIGIYLHENSNQKAVDKKIQ